MPIREEQKTNKQHPVPQNIMDVEFKLIGDLTMRQFVYLIVFGLAAYLSYALIPTFLRWFFALGFVLLGIGLAFVPLAERGLDDWIANFFDTIYSPTQRIWKKEVVVPSAFGYKNIAVVKQELITLAPTSSRRKLEEYLEMQEGTKREVDALDIPIGDYVNKVRQAFADYVPEETLAPVVEEKPAPVPPLVKRPKEEEKPVEKKVREEKVSKKPEIEKQPEPIKKPSKPKPRISPRRVSDVFLSPITPDRHSGRRFVNLTPGQGSIILPIRGERVLKTSEEMEIEQDINEKTTQLKELMAQITSGEQKEGVSPSSAVVSLAQQVRKHVLEEKPEEKPSEETKTAVVGTPHLGVFPVVTKPNMIVGVVKNNQGSVLPNVILLIRNREDEPIRALKTDALGQFFTSTSLPNGVYKVEVDSTKKTNLSFDIISVDLKGQQLPPLEVVGS